MNRAELLKHGKRVEGLHVDGRKAYWVSVVVAGEEDDSEGGFMLVEREHVAPAVPRVAVAEILRLRALVRWQESRRLLAGPERVFGRQAKFGSFDNRPGLGAEYDALGLRFVPADEDVVAGTARLQELLTPDSELAFPEFVFPESHPRHGEKGAKRLFVAAGCRRLLEQLGAAPAAEDDEPGAGGAVSARWEANAGGLFAALRYVALSRPGPSEWKRPPSGDMRRRGIDEALEARDRKFDQPPGTDWDRFSW